MYIHLVELEAMQTVSSPQTGYAAFTLNSQEDEFVVCGIVIVV
jgi:hypothetical protein